MSALLGGLIGLERESVNRPAGFQTHILVSVGSALVMLVSVYGFSEELAAGRFSDPARLAAQVVSGIGFLGAGTILKEGSSIRGLTTAASLWVVAGIGLAVGSGFYSGAIGATSLVYLALSAFSRLDERWFHRPQYQTIQVEASDRPGQLGAIGSWLGQANVSILNVRIEREESHSERVTLQFFVKLPADLRLQELVASLLKIDGVVSVAVGS